MVRDIKKNAISLHPTVAGMMIKHPLNTAQLDSLRSTVRYFEFVSQLTSQAEDADVFTAPQPSLAMELSETAILLSLFGWSIICGPSNQPQQMSVSRAPSVSLSALRTPASSRAPSMQPATPVLSYVPTSVTRTPERQLSPSTPARPPRTPSFTFRMPLSSGSSVKKIDRTLLQCLLCQRRIGLWAFTLPHVDSPQTPIPGADAADAHVNNISPSPKTAPERQFDLLKEHRSYCPYVVRSTVIPALPLPLAANVSLPNANAQFDSDVMEGWRAVLTIVLRYGVGQRKRIGLDWIRGDQEVETMEIDEVKAMVDRVKAYGGKELLRYVKGLLG